MLSYDPAKAELITTKAQLAKWVKLCTDAKSVSFDLETTGLDIFNDEIVGVSVAIEKDGEVLCNYIPIAHRTKTKQLPIAEVLQALKPILEGPKPIVGSNLLFDWLILSQPRYTVRINNIHDTVFASYAYYGNSVRGHGMDDLAERLFEFKTIKFAEVVTDRPGRTNFRDVPLPEALTYASEDTAVVLMAMKALEHLLKKEGLWDVYQRDRLLIPVLHSMKLAGTKIDIPFLASLEAPWRKETEKAKAKCRELAYADALRMPVRTAEEVESSSYAIVRADHFNPRSSADIIAALKTRGIELPEDRDGKVSADKDALQEFEGDELVDLVLRFKALSTLLSNFVGKLPKVVDAKDRVHGNFNACVTKTGRFSGSDPNLQNIPTRTKEGEQVRQAFIAEKGMKLISADYSQIEYRVLSHITEDPYLLHCYRNGIDLHAKMAADVHGGDWQAYNDKKDRTRYKLRTAFKNVNFAVIYGAGPAKVARMSQIEVPEAYAILDAHRDMAPKVYTWKEEVWESARELQYVETLFGRRIHVPYINSRNGSLRGHAERLSVNGIVQGSAADLMRFALVKVHRELAGINEFARPCLLMTVHDELVIECLARMVDEVASIVQTQMETAADALVTWRVPIIAEVGEGNNWREAK